MKRGTLESTIAVSEQLLKYAEENFRLKYDKEPYYFSGASAALPLSLSKESTGYIHITRYGEGSPFTQEEQDAMKIIDIQEEIELEKQKELHIKKIGLLRKYCIRKGISPEDLVDAFPDSISKEEEDENYWD